MSLTALIKTCQLFMFGGYPEILEPFDLTLWQCKMNKHLVRGIREFTNITLQKKLFICH